MIAAADSPGKRTGGGRTSRGRSLEARVERARQKAELADLRLVTQVREQQRKDMVALAGSYPERGGRFKRDRGAATRGGSADAHRDRRSIQEQRAAAQHLDRTHPLARGMVQRKIDLEVSDGFSLQVKTSDPGFNKEARAAFNEWADALWGNGPDIRGLMTLDEMIADLPRAWATDGDRLCLLTDSGHVQQIEAERIVNPAGPNGSWSDTATMKSGVELDGVGRPVRFHIAEWARDGSSMTRTTTNRGAADGRCLWLPNPLRHTAGSTRGEPQLTASIGLLEDLGEYEKAVRVARRMAACYGLVRKKLNPSASMPGLAGSIVTPGVGSSDQSREIEYAPGMDIALGIGEDIEQIQPAQPGDSYQEYFFSQVMLAGADQTVPLFLAVLDARMVNLASMRAMMQIIWRNVVREQQAMIVRFAAPVYRFWMARQVRRGVFKFRDDWAKHEWIAPTPPAMDAKAEYEANRIAVQARFKSIERVHKEMGIDTDDEFAAIARRQEEMKKLGILPVDQPGTKDPSAAGRSGKDEENAEGAEGAEERGEGKAAAEDAGTTESSEPRNAAPTPGGKPTAKPKDGEGGFLVGDKTLASELVGAVANKTKPPESAKAILETMVGLDPQQAGAIIDPATAFKAAETVTAGPPTNDGAGGTGGGDQA